MRTDQIEPVALAVMQRQAVISAQDCVDQNIRFLYRDIAAASVRDYINACRVPFQLSTQLRSEYENEVLRHLLAEGSRRSWPTG